MAQRFNAAQLKEMIRSLVREEIKQVVAETINEVLSERYLRQLAESVAVSKPRGVSSLEQMGDDAIEEPPPQPLANSREWPFDKHPMKHDDHVSAEHGEDQEDTDYRKHGEDPTSIFFEGTRSLKEIEEQAPTEDDIASQYKTAPLPKNLNEQKRVWTTLAGVGKKQDAGLDPNQVAAREEARLKRLREQLEVKA